jgi:hypothetical protein
VPEVWKRATGKRGVVAEMTPSGAAPTTPRACEWAPQPLAASAATSPIRQALAAAFHGSRIPILGDGDDRSPLRSSRHDAAVDPAAR